MTVHTGAPEFSIITAASGLRAGAVSVPDLVEQSLAQADAIADLAAFTEIYADHAKALARAHQALIANGCDLGPLHGIPVAVKANVAVAGKRMTAGSKLLADRIADTDADATQALKRQGAIIIGATNMHEFAWGGTTANPHFGQCRNPWDRNRIPAGSSGGSGAAVAARAVFAALGTDTGGSIRLPASMNGLTGLRPGVGRLSTGGIFPLAWSMDTVGPIAPSAADCAIVHAALCGESVPAGFAAAGRPASLSGKRIAVPTPYAFAALQTDVETTFRDALRQFEALGAVVDPVSLADLDIAVDAQVIVDAAEPSAIHADWVRTRPEDYGDDVRILLEAGLAFTAEEYIQAQRYRTLLRRQFERIFIDHDLVLTPTLPFTAPLIGQATVMLGGREESTLTGNMRFTCLASLAALPAASFPIGFDTAGLPVGGQLIGPHDSEMAILAAVHAFQGASDHHLRRPSAGQSLTSATTG
ncbi:amidase [Pleomorphomonas carboxyditropha]|uniref:Amidase n=1 Tax=Pleomorphomonas carboxyditropha TaxID=2023338 RepID=A0A2G9WZC6_9HYPH|nr:amidase [Pleomorphomonas carboxyditropha]PIP00078.1 amidase [Pleomorphomonas carboxyditropha]